MRIGAILQALALASSAAIFLGGCPRPPSGGGPASPTPAPPSLPVLVQASPTPAPLPAPPPTPYVPNKRMEVGRMFNGMQVKTSLETDFGSTAAADRTDPANYAVEVKVNVKVPKPHKEMEQLTKLNPNLATVLPGLSGMLEAAKVSPVFDDLYRLKVANLQQNLTRFDSLLSRHNFYDCETVLELQHAETKRKALLVQSDMDTDTDGSDSDRVLDVDGSSVTFQPFTSYRWAKKTRVPSPFLAGRQAKLKQAQLDLAVPGLPPAKQQELKTLIARLREETADLQKYSNLVAYADPFVVLPGSMTRNKTAFTPAVGDYCVVIYGTTLYPAIVGDIGPAYKMGEGSLRLCKQISARADSANRAESDLKVTYVVFPGTGDKPWDAPDLAKWRARCESLLKEIGGFGGQLYTWEDITKPAPPLAPTLLPAPGSGLVPTTPMAPSSPVAPTSGAPQPSAVPSTVPAPAAPGAYPSSEVRYRTEPPR